MLVYIHVFLIGILSNLGKLHAFTCTFCRKDYFEQDILDKMAPECLWNFCILLFQFHL